MLFIIVIYVKNVMKILKLTIYYIKKLKTKFLNQKCFYQSYKTIQTIYN